MFCAAVLVTCFVKDEVWGQVVQVQTSQARSDMQTRALVVERLSRSYLLYVPESLVDRPPLVFVLHGGGGSAEQMVRSSGFNDLADREGALVCYPNAIERNWNDGRGVSFMRSQRENIDDVKFIRRLIDELDREFEIDRGRVFATGASNGGIMSHRLASEASDAFAAIAPVIGGMAESIAEDFKPEHPVSILVIQGDEDPLVPFEGGDVGSNLRRTRGKIIATEKMLELYLEHNEIDGDPRVSQLHDRVRRDNTTVERTIYPAAKDGTLVQYYRVKGGGHTWPGKPAYANERFIGRANRDINASELIWNFFTACPPRHTEK